MMASLKDIRGTTKLGSDWQTFHARIGKSEPLLPDLSIRQEQARGGRSRQGAAGAGKGRQVQARGGRCRQGAAGAGIPLIMLGSDWQIRAIAAGFVTPAGAGKGRQVQARGRCRQGAAGAGIPLIMLGSDWQIRAIAAGFVTPAGAGKGWQRAMTGKRGGFYEFDRRGNTRTDMLED